jgi:hypothetical protein
LRAAGDRSVAVGSRWRLPRVLFAVLSALVIAQSSARIEAAPIAIVAPSGLANSQKFRIMVVTSAVTNAISTDINY